MVFKVSVTASPFTKMLDSLMSGLAELFPPLTFVPFKTGINSFSYEKKLVRELMTHGPNLDRLSWA